MIQASPILGMARRAACATRIAMFAAGLSVAWAANAANCTDAPVSGRNYYIVNKASGLQLDVAYGSREVGANVIQWTGGTQTNQQWTLAEMSRGIWTIRAVHSGQALDLWGYNPSEDAAVKQYTYSGNSNQQWLVVNSGDAYTIASNSSKKLLTVGDKTAGSALKQHSDQQGSALQRWYFNPADGNKCSSGATGAFGSFMGFNKVLIGGALDETSPSHPTPDTINRAPWDVRYSYIHSRPAPKAACYTVCTLDCKNGPDGGWWGCWGMSSDGKWNTEPAMGISWTNDRNVNFYKYNGQPHRMMQQWTWYSGEDIGKVQRELNRAAGRDSSFNDYKGAVNNPTLLKSYLDDYRFFLTKIGTAKNIIHLEPDFWGFLREQDPQKVARPNDPHLIPAAVRTAGGKDCAAEENSVAGLASCMINMARNYAPKSTVGLHMSCWDISEKDSTYRGPKACLSYYQALGAGKGDFLVGDASDRDAAWYSAQGNQYAWWDDTKFAQYLSVIKMMTEGVGKPMIIWQIPLGNMNQNNTRNHYQDNKVWYLFTNMQKVADAHVVVLQFGAGHHEQTSTETDGEYLLNFAKDYYNKGGVPLR